MVEISDSANPYNLRRTDEFNIPRYRLNTTINSFYPSTIRSWNNTNAEARHNSSINQFKSYLKSQNHDRILPKYLLYGERKLNVLQTRIRCISSNLNSDLFRINLTDSPLCQCGHYLEDSFHFLLECCRYNQERFKLFQTLSNYRPIGVGLLLFGNPTLTNEENELIMLATQTFIKDTKRFTTWELSLSLSPFYININTHEMWYIISILIYNIYMSRHLWHCVSCRERALHNVLLTCSPIQFLRMEIKYV